MHNIHARPFPFSQQPAPLMWPPPGSGRLGGDGHSWPFLATWAQSFITTGRGEAGGAAGGGEGLGLLLHVITLLLFLQFYSALFM